MTDTVTLTDHEAIRDWAAARIGSPAIVDISPAAGTQPMLRIVFDQQAYQDQDMPERPVNMGGVELVEWDDWFAEFDKQKLALIVAADQPGIRDSFYQMAARSDDGAE